MVYGLIGQIYRREFSWGGDLRQTTDHLRSIGIQKIFVDLPGKVLGKITDLGDVLAIELVHTTGTLLEAGAGINYIVGNETHAKVQALVGLFAYGIILYHHWVQGDRSDNSLGDMRQLPPLEGTLR